MDIEGLFRVMHLIRRTEERVAEIYPSDKIKSPVHLSIGQEAVAAAVCAAMREDDIVFGSYRSHASYIAKGGDLRAMIAELYGKATGCAKGKGGSMHLVDAERGVMGTSAVVGSTIPNAVGYAYAAKLRGEDRVVVSFFGDGATEEGVFCESLNFAALKKLPVLFVCENNRYAIHTHQSKRQALQNISEKARAFGVRTVEIVDGDVLGMHAQATDAMAALRGPDPVPVLMECMTYRWKEHVGPNEDFSLGYRSREEMVPWVDGDQIERLRREIGVARAREVESLVEREIDDAFLFAEQSPFPADAELFTDVYKN